jgi:hypothetical protein
VGTKWCSKCEQELDIEAFGKNKGRTDGRQSWCRACKAAYDSAKYHEPNSRTKAQIRAANDQARERAREFVYDYLIEHPCVDCGEADPIVLEFDHVRGKKHANISKLVQDASINKIKAEIKKCDVRCSNCHTKKTAKQRGYYRMRR